MMARHRDDVDDGNDDDDDDKSSGDADCDTAHAPAAPPDRINLVTLNCWGLRYISTLRAARLAEIGRRLAGLEPAPDVVCLQECWVRDDFAAVRRAVRRRLPHAKLYRAGVWGAGLAVLSRWPVRESSMVPFPLNGRPTAFWRGDWFVGKGVACATLRVGPRPHHVVHVFNTHTHAPYEREPDDSYVCHRTAQAWHVAKLLAAAAERGHLVVALGDFNMLPRSLAHRIITARAPVRDVWRVLHPDSSLGPADHPSEAARGRPLPSAAFKVGENGATSDGLYNTWRWTRSRQKRLRAGHDCPVDPAASDPRGKRLDYIFASADPGWAVESADVALTDRHPHLHVSLSDHFAVRATLRRQTPSLLAAPPSSTSASDDDIGDAAALTLSEYDEILAMTRAYVARERTQRRWRALHFCASVAVWAACLAAVWFSPRPLVAFLLMLLASLGLVAGVVDGLLALLFFSSELRSLDEFEWEVRNARRTARAAGLTSSATSSGAASGAASSAASSPPQPDHNDRPP